MTATVKALMLRAPRIVQIDEFCCHAI